MKKPDFKRILRIMFRSLVVTIIVALLGALFVWNNGIQYSLAILTGSLRDPCFDGQQYDEEASCYSEERCESGVIRMLTYNVLCRVCVKEDYDPWDERILYLRGLVERYDPDLIGSQELGSWRDIVEFLPGDDVYGVVSFDFGPWTYADSALFYRKARYDLLDAGQFWLSPTPHLPFGFPWKPLSMPRYVSWAFLRDRENGFTFLYMNSHVDNNPLNKDNSAPLVFDVFAPHAYRMPVIFTGDFNTNATTERYQVFQRGPGDDIVFVNAADLAPALELQQYTPEQAEPVDTVPFDRFEHMIDHVFLAGPVEKEVLRWVVDYNTYGDAQRPASDHPAVYSEIRLSLR